jgi:hypothetical protein
MGSNFVLLPGETGCGKTHLALWYRAHGFELMTDEIVTTAKDPEHALLCGALRRPAVLKAPTDPNTLLRPGETPIAQQPSSCGLLLKLPTPTSDPPETFGRGLLVFSRFTAGAPLTLSALSAGEACLRLMQNCLNARNLSGGGLPFASVLARNAQAIALEYGAATQLDGTLDVLTRQLLAARSTPADVAALCAAFTAKETLQSFPQAASAANTARAMREETSVKPDPDKRAAPPPTIDRFPRRLSIGMATFDDFDGVYFTIQSIRVNNPELAGDLEFIVVDNNPSGLCSEPLSRLGKWIDGYRYLPRGEWSGTAIRNIVFEEASSPIVLCMDSHVLLVPGALSQLISYLERDPKNADLVQGPLVYDDLRNRATHFEPKWRAGMYGTWASDPRGNDPANPGFDIPMQGLGLFACRRAAWPGFHPKFRGFGGEEGYIHEKFRQRGGRTLCLPFLQWVHRFHRPLGPPYLNRWEDRMRNYFIGFIELGLETAEMEAHFAELLGAETAARIFAEIRQELAGG